MSTGTMISAVPERRISSLPHRKVRKIGRVVALTLAKLTYTSAYFVGFSAVSSAVLLARAFPRGNPIITGFQDGGRAAADFLGENNIKGRRK